MPKEKKDYKLNKLSFVNENMLVKTCTQASNIIYYIDDLHIMGKFLFMSSFCMLKTGVNTLTFSKDQLLLLPKNKFQDYGSLFTPEILITKI